MKNARQKSVFAAVVVTLMIVLIVAIIGVLNRTNAESEILKLEKGPLKSEELSELAVKLQKAMCVNDKYPDYYGGSYPRNGNLIIFLTTKNRKVKTEVKESIGQEEGIVFIYVKYSLNELKELQKEIGETYERLYKEGDEEIIKLLNNITRSDVREITNTVVIGVTDITDEKVKALKKIFGNDNRIRYEEGGRNADT